MNEITWGRGDQLNAPMLHDLLQLRIDTFVVEHANPYRDIDGHDLLATTWHGWVTDPATARIVAAVRVLCDMEPAQIGRLVTRPDHRSRGLGTAVLHAAHERAGGAGSFLEAQRSLTRWFEGFGWMVSGDEFVENGVPYLPMRRARN